MFRSIRSVCDVACEVMCNLLVAVEEVIKNCHEPINAIDRLRLFSALIQ
jgi:hypothetical protein